MKKNIILTLLSLLLLQGAVYAEVIKFAQIADAHFIAGDKYREQVLQEAVNSINNQNFQIPDSVGSHNQETASSQN